MGSEVVEKLAQEDPISEGLGQVEDLCGLPGDPVGGGQHLAVDQPHSALSPVLHHGEVSGRSNEMMSERQC